MKQLVIISDIHGCYKTLLRLLDQAMDKWGNCQPVFLGDLVDRGPDSASMVDYAMEYKVPCVMGNHEHLMVDALRCTGIYDEGLWRYINGGNVTLDSFSGTVPEPVLKWMEKLPVQLEFPEFPDLILSHTGHSELKGDNPLLEWGHPLWCRGIPKQNDGKFRVYGHTQASVPDIREFSANIDTGCAYKRYGHLTAFHWPSREVLTIPNCE